MMRGFTVIAIIAAYNEEDIIGRVLDHLIGQGISAYLLDDGSTDKTVQEAERFLGRGLLAVEKLSPPEGDGGCFELERIMRRKQSLGEELQADWFINHDADELRESPWPHLNLCQAIQLVDRLGWNAIDFAVLNFPPTSGGAEAGRAREAIEYCEPGADFDRLQIRCWKNTGAAVDLVSSAGHEARFADRRVFPIRFVLRHYPIRSQAHGNRKVYEERIPRFDPRERSRGWHIQYDGTQPGRSFVRDPATLTQYDPDRVRVELSIHHRDVERLEESIRQQRAEADMLRAALAEQADAVESLRQVILARDAEVSAAGQHIAALEGANSELARQLEELRASRSWRWTAVLRAVHGRLLRPVR